MAFNFPEDKADFRAPNGVTYSWDGTKWVTKTFKADESALADYVKTDDFTADQLRQDDAFEADQTRQDDAFAAGQEAQDLAASELTERVSDGELKQRQIELALEELSVTKGSVARYTVTETHIGAAIRNGELYVSSPNAADVQAISFAPFDINGQPTRPANTGDIIEFVETTRDIGQVTRYRIVSGGDSQALTVEYISGNNDFAKGKNEEVYIYPQNEEGVSQDYVDGQDALLQEEVDKRVKKTGDTMTGHLKMTRPDATTSGYIFSVEAPHLEDDKQVAFRVTGNGKVKAGHDTSHAFMASDANDVITKQYIDEKVVKTSGTQSLNSAKWKIQQPDSDGVNRNYIEIENKNMKLFHVQDCTDGADEWAANKGYVDSKVADSVDGLATEQYVDEAVAAIPAPTGGVPVGSIMIWINSIAPSGWLKLKGGSFDINAYPLLHAYLQQSDGYVSGNLPDWRGHYPGQIGDHLNGDVGIKLPQQTAKPSGGSPRSSSSFNNGENKTANKAGSSDFAGIRKGQVSIDSGWDEVTRPKTVAVHYIIKHD